MGRARARTPCDRAQTGKGPTVQRLMEKRRRKTRCVCVLGSALVAAAATGQSKEQLAAWLARFPEADANKDGVLTVEEARAFREARRKRGGRQDRFRKAVIKPSHANVAYGPHPRNVLDLWLATSEKPTPLLVCIHGGGFRQGDKKKYAGDRTLIRAMDKAGVSVAAINYRLTEGGKHPYPAAMHDGARAVQFLRYNAAKYNLDKTRFAATGGSAGGCMLMWLGFHPDLAQPDHEDPVLRESSRLQVLAPKNGPSCLHVPTLKQWFEVESLLEHPALRPLFGLPEEGEIQWTDKLDAMMRDASPVTHLTADDPPVYMTFGAARKVHAESPPGLWVHHPVMGLKLKEAMDRLGLECHVQYTGGPPIPEYASQQDFIIRKLTGRKGGRQE